MLRTLKTKLLQAVAGACWACLKPRWPASPSRVASPRQRRFKFEPLEERAMLAIADSFVAGHLVFTGTGADEVLTVQINNAAGTSVQYNLGAGTVVRNGVVDIAFDGVGGNDTFNLVGSSANDIVSATINAADTITWGVPITTANVRSVSIDTGTGSDTVTANVTALTVTTATVNPQSSTFNSAAKTFATAGTETLTTTVATVNQLTLNDSTSDDTLYYLQPPLTATPSVQLVGGGLTNTVTGALATLTIVNSTAGGSDTAFIQGSAANDSLVAMPTYTQLDSGGCRAFVASFERTYSYAGAGGTDVAQLFGSAGDDQYFRNPTYQVLLGSGYFNQVTGFAQNYAFSQGGNDVATFTGSATTELFYGLPAYSILLGPGNTPHDQSIGFKTTRVTSGGGADKAVLYDSAGDDQFVSSPTQATMSGNNYSVEVNNYRFVTAIAAFGGAESAVMNGSTGNDVLISTVGNVVLQDAAAAVYLLQCASFDNIVVQASTGFDVAGLYDSTGNDSIVVGGTDATLYTPTQTTVASGFDNVGGIRSTGVDDEILDARSFNYSKNAGWVSSASKPQLGQADTNQLLRRAAAASSSNDAIIAIVDRNGIILGVRVESGINSSYYDHSLYGSFQEYLNFAIDGAVAKARTAAFFSSNDAPLTSRTVRFISQSTIAERAVDSNPSVTNPSSPVRGPGFVAPIGVGGRFPPEVQFTPLVDLFNIEHTNRDSLRSPGADRIMGTGDDETLTTRFNVNPLFVSPGQALTAPVAYGVASGFNTNAQSRGIATLPGGIPIYKNNVLVGGIGVFFPGPKGFASFEQGFVKGIGQTEAMRTNSARTLESEWIAFAAVGGAPVTSMPVGTLNGVSNVPGIATLNGRIDLVGITLEQIGPGSPLNSGPNTIFAVGTSVGVGNPNSGTNQRVSTSGATVIPGKAAPEGWLVNPHNSQDNTITAADINTIIQQGINEAVATRAAIRLPLGTRTKMVFTVTDTTGEVLGQYRMPDATYFSIDVATAKARNVAYYNDAGALQAQDKLPAANIPAGTAFTARTFRYLVSPRYPTGAGTAPPAPFSILNAPGINPANGENTGAALPASAYDNTVGGYDAFHPGTNFRDTGDPGAGTKNQNGIIFFPGSSGIYKTIGGVRRLVGGFGVSGDGVDQDDVVTVGGQVGFEPLNAQRIDADPFLFTYGGVPDIRLPYQKFNRNPRL
jgi:uncharacterized protein GlcG (DUF336 family)